MFFNSEVTTLPTITSGKEDTSIIWSLVWDPMGVWIRGVPLYTQTICMELNNWLEIPLATSLITVGWVLKRGSWLWIASFYTRHNQKNTHWIILHVTTPLLLNCTCDAYVCLRSPTFNLTCVWYSCRSSRMSLRWFKPTVNLPTPSKVQLSLE